VLQVCVCVHLTQQSLRTWQGFGCFLFAVESLEAVELVCSVCTPGAPNAKLPSAHLCQPFVRVQACGVCVVCCLDGRVLQGRS
jgi:hypothetical protein